MSGISRLFIACNQPICLMQTTCLPDVDSLVIPSRHGIHQVIKANLKINGINKNSDLIQKIYGDNYPRTALVCYRLSELYFEHGQFSSAEKFSRKAYERSAEKK